MAKKSREVVDEAPEQAPEIDEDAVGALVLRLERSVESLRQHVATETSRMAQTVASTAQKLDVLTERFGGIRADWDKERADWRQKSKELDDIILRQGADSRRTREQMDNMRAEMRMIKVPKVILEPLEREVGALKTGLEQFKESVATHEEKLRKELKTYVPSFRTRGREHDSGESTAAPIRDLKAKEAARAAREMAEVQEAAEKAGFKKA